jgi:hypothetical protein
VERLSLAEDGCYPCGGGDGHLVRSKLALHAFGDLLEKEGLSRATNASEEDILACETEVQNLLLFGVEGGGGCLDFGALVLGLLLHFCVFV